MFLTAIFLLSYPLVASAGSSDCDPSANSVFSDQLKTLSVKSLTLCQLNTDTESAQSSSLIKHNIKRALALHLAGKTELNTREILDHVSTLKRNDLCSGLELEAYMLNSPNKLFVTEVSNNSIQKFLLEVISAGRKCQHAKQIFVADSYIVTVLYSSAEYQKIKNSKHHATLLSELLSALKQKSSQSARALGLMMIREKNNLSNEAFNLIKLAASMGNINAQVDLGVLGILGNGPAKDALFEMLPDVLEIAVLRDLCVQLSGGEICLPNKVIKTYQVPKTGDDFAEQFFELRLAVGHQFDW